MPPWVGGLQHADSRNRGALCRAGRLRSVETGSLGTAWRSVCRRSECRCAGYEVTTDETPALRKNQLLLFIDGDAADPLTVRASAFGSHRKNPTITGYCVGASLNCFSLFR